ncbi:MAG: hypothetical protein M1832_005443 [Thelocarpon impressellum]|nr:MAG: hypothetical protein M1832_005443 [Thelocarpon impressellum]
MALVPAAALARSASNTTWAAPTQSAHNLAFDALISGYVPPTAMAPAGYVPPVDLWWNEQKIHSTVTREFVASKLQRMSRMMDQPLAFGDGLTDDTYIDWILERSRRLFLILVDIGVPEQIFAITDDSWDDEDLPISRDAVDRLCLSSLRDDEIGRRFYRRQFYYMMQELNRGDHVTYAEDEVVPLQLCSKRVGAGFQSSEKVFFPRRPEEVLTRKRVSFGQLSSRVPEKHFKALIDGVREMVHQHIVSVYASYTLEGHGYVLLTPATDLTLRNFIHLPPQRFRSLPKQKQREIMLNWLHCLAEAVAFLHGRGVAHQNIRPSSIMIDGSDKILLGVTGAFEQLLADKRPNPLECYDYGAPELWAPRNSLDSQPELDAPWGSSPVAAKRTSGATPSVWRTSLSPVVPGRDRSSTTGSSVRSMPSEKSSDDGSEVQQSDVFSLACVYLDILTFVLKRKSTAFASHRSAKNKSPIMFGGHADSSFHANLGQLESWIKLLEARAIKKGAEAMQGIPAMLRLCARMLAREASERPSAKYVEEILCDVLLGPARRGTVHCGSLPHGLDDPFGETASFVTKQSSGSSSSSRSRSMSTMKMRAQGWSRSSTRSSDPGADGSLDALIAAEGDL